MRYFRSKPISIGSLQGNLGNYQRADLELYGVDPSGPSYEGRVFLNTPDADETTPLDDPGYIGSFFIFGKGNCWGEEGHCDPPTSRRAYDKRLPHPMAPDRIRLSIPEGKLGDVIARTSDGMLTMSVVPVVPNTAGYAGLDLDNIFKVKRISIITYR